MTAGSVSKNDMIASTMRATYEKRRSQECRVFKVKIQRSSLSRSQMDQFQMLFIEAKWCYNSMIAFMKDNDISDYDTKAKTVVHKDKDGKDVTSEYGQLPVSIRQTIQARIKSSLKTLATRKKRGFKVGALGFTSHVGSLEYKQYGVTHKILDRHKVKLQGIKGTIRVNGLDQFLGGPDYEIANWKLLRMPDGYYIAITTYIDKDKVERKAKNGRTVGIDFGCRTSFTTSDGDKESVTVRETERLKHLQKKIAKQEKGSQRWLRTRQLIAVEYQKIDNRKKDKANKTIARFRENSVVIIQDEMLPLWHKSHFGKTVQHGILGRVKSGLMRHDDTIVLSRSLPTTKLCRECGHLEKVKLSDTEFHCSVCGCAEDRDVHAARNMVWLFEHNVGVERTEIKRGEIREALDKAFANSRAEGR